MSKTQGGTFKSGFLSAAFTQSLSRSSIFEKGATLSNTFKAAIIGGIGSSLGGGKFANGATTAAFSYMFGEMARRDSVEQHHGSGQQGNQNQPAFMNDAGVQSDLNQAWVDSNPNAPNVPRGQPGSLKVEQGGWVVQDKVTGAYSTIRVAPGTRDSLATIVGTRPNSTAVDVVGWFHTHPNTAAEGYTYTPSPGDRGFTRGYAKVTGVIKTHNGDQFIPYP